MPLEGPVFAIVTPFDERGRVDGGALHDYLQFLWGCGVRQIVVNGTTGEFASLTLYERRAVLEQCRRSFTGRIVAHVSSCCYLDAEQLLAHAREHADAALLLPPFYYANLDPTECLAFLRHVLAGAAMPVYLYNFPEHTQAPITPEMFEMLVGEFGCVAGIKDSGGDLRVSAEYKGRCPGRQVFVGGDRCALEVLELGLDGSVTGGGNPVPEHLVRLHEQFAAGDRDAARRTQAAFDAWTAFREAAPIRELPLVKAALGARVAGFPPHVRPPLITADEQEAARIRSTLVERLLP